MGFGTVISSIVAVILSLGLVLGLAWGAIWLLKKVQDRQMGIGKDDPDRGDIRFLRSLPLGQRERVTLIECDGERMLLGVTAGGISMLARWPQTEGTKIAKGTDA
ncbi:MAG: flagellar biosynthetic protein FliO [Sphingorhabdus sp.]